MVVLVVAGRVVVMVDAFVLVEGQSVVLVVVVYDEIVGVVVVVDGKDVALVVEREDDLDIAFKKEDRNVLLLIVRVCVVEVIDVIGLVEVRRVDCLVGALVVDERLSVVLVEVVVEVFVGVVVVECGNLVSIEVVRRVNVVAVLAMVERG